MAPSRRQVLYRNNTSEQFLPLLKTYYLNQARNQQHGGAGAAASIPVFRGAAYQRGHGIGSFFASLFRTILPVVKSAGKALGRQAFRTGLDVLGDVTAGGNLKQSLKRRAGEAGEALKEKTAGKVSKLMEGRGRVGRRRRRRAYKKPPSRQLTIIRRLASAKKRPKRRQLQSHKQPLDIFSGNNGRRR